MPSGGYLVNRSYPVLQIDDYHEAKQFYVDWLGFKIEWEWRHEPGFPVYMRLLRGDLGLHITEHRDDCSPGGSIYFEVDDIDSLYQEWKRKRPGWQVKPENQPWGMKEIVFQDPFKNKLSFGCCVGEKQVSI